MSTEEPHYPQNHQRKRRPKHQQARAPPASSSLNRTQLRKKIRDVSRLLQNTSRLSATTRADHERALAAYQHELAQAQADDKRKQMAEKYHMVRFFERRKATRKIKTLKRRLEAEPKLAPQLHDAEVDLAYILYYPPLEKYISLFRRSETEEPKTDDKRKAVWRDIEERMKHGQLGKAWEEEADPEEGQRQSTKKSKMKEKKDKWGQKVKSAASQEEEIEEDAHGDGGFFEF